MSDTPSDLNTAIAGHWSRQDALGWITDRLRREGILEPGFRDVARFDQIHAGGLRAVQDMAARAPIRSGQRVVDLGGGLGGAARYLAGELGCEVVCVDLTPALVRAGQTLTDLVGLGGRVLHVAADATRAPLPDGAFDGAWVQHLALHIPESECLWREVARLLRPGGWLAFHEWLRGDTPQPLLYPSPWAPPDGSLSFLVDRARLCTALAQAGFTDLRLDDVSRAMAEAYGRQLQALHVAPGIGNPVLPAGETLVVLENAQRNLREARALCVIGTASKAH